MQSSEMRAWVEIDLGALQQNAATLAERAGVPLLPMIKADAYGLGAIPVARVLERVDPWGYGVATIREGLELRAAGITRPVIVFTPLAADELADVRAAALTPSLSRVEAITRWRSDGGGPWHLAVDTGMSRTGVRWDEIDGLREAIAACPPEGAYTHLHSAELNDGSCEEQESRFRVAIEALANRPPLLHVENSAAIARRRGSIWDCVRPGLFLYGVGSGDGATLEPQPVVGVYARVVDLRRVRDGDTVSYDATYRAVGDRRIATLGIGYADGYPRALSNRGGALLGARRVCVAGIVTMDMTMVDVTDVACSLGEVATVIGGTGDTRLDVASVARAAEMSPYELLTRLRSRIARVYRSDGGRA
jgi:alanine racemase